MVLVMMRLTCLVCAYGRQYLDRDVKAKLHRYTEMLQTREGYIGVDLSLCHAGAK